ncbi:MAG: phage integrase SAM-like domain-containing protein [Prevotella sp.]
MKTLTTVFNNYVASHPRRVSTMKLYGFAYGVFEASSCGGERLVNDVSHNDISQFVSYITKSYSANSAYVIFGIIRSIFEYAKRSGIIAINPCDMVDVRRHFGRHKHHQALTRKQMEACENDFWKDITGKCGTVSMATATVMVTDIRCELFQKMCFILGYYLQGLSFADILSLKQSSVIAKCQNGMQCYIIETKRKKTGKAVKIVIPKSHTMRYMLFDTLFHIAKKNGAIHLIPPMDEIEDNDTYIIYNKVNRMNGTMNRCLKRWWKQLNSTILADTPIDVRATSFYSCRHTFATLYMESPDANLSELASLMGRNAEYIDTYIRELEADEVLMKASDKVYCSVTSSNKGYDALLKNQKKIIKIMGAILEMMKSY